MSKMQAKSQRFLIVARDPGATNSLVGLVWWVYRLRKGVLDESRDILNAIQVLNLKSMLSKSPITIDVQTSLACRGFWDDLLQEFPDISHYLRITVLEDREIDAELLDVIFSPLPDVLISGLDDVDAKGSRCLQAGARDRGVPVICMADNHVNLAIRCKSAKNAEFFPDRLGVLAEEDKVELRSIGFPESFLFVVPNFHKLRLAVCDRAFVDCREHWGVREGEVVVLFPSLVGKEMELLGRKPPFDEVAILKRLVNQLANSKSFPPGYSEFIVPALQNIHLIVRPHPRENIAKFKWLEEAEGVRITLSSYASSRDAILSTDWVVGIDCGLVDDAKVLGAKTYVLDEMV